MTAATLSVDADHLHALGVRDDTLSADERAALDRDGYLIFPGLIDPAWLERLRAAFDARLDFLFRYIPPQNQTSRHLFDLVNIDAACDGIWSHPRLLAAMRHILGRPFKLSSLNGRDPVKGEGGQGLHQDWGRHAAGEPAHVANSLWILDDFTEDNGATRVVPGTHRLDSAALDGIAREAEHPRQVTVQAKAGDVLVINAHLWHGGTLNRGGARRRVMHAYFTAREHSQQTDQRAYLRVATQRRLSPAQRWILDVD
jgi:hypothetical protein